MSDDVLTRDKPYNCPRCGEPMTGRETLTHLCPDGPLAPPEPEPEPEPEADDG